MPSQHRTRLLAIAYKTPIIREDYKPHIAEKTVQGYAKTNVTDKRRVRLRDNKNWRKSDAHAKVRHFGC
jgi:hypothetical protein